MRVGSPIKFLHEAQVVDGLIAAIVTPLVFNVAYVNALGTIQYTSVSIARTFEDQLTDLGKCRDEADSKIGRLELDIGHLQFLKSEARGLRDGCQHRIDELNRGELVTKTL